jgi:GNAT superfamily N-acetyltransferase
MERTRNAMKVITRQAAPGDVDTVLSILQEAAAWLTQMGQPLWRLDELTRETVRADVNAGIFFLFEIDGAVVGTVKFQLTDDFIWPDLDPSDSAFIHRLAIRRSAAGGQLSARILQWAIEETRRRGRSYLRLDCEASRAKLRALYESFGFQHVDDRQAGPYFVSRYQLPIT